MSTEDRPYLEFTVYETAGTPEEVLGLFHRCPLAPYAMSFHHAY